MRPCLILVFLTAAFLPGYSGDDGGALQQHMPEQNFAAKVGEEITVIIPTATATNNEHCTILSPDGTRSYLTEYKNAAFKVFEETGVDCGVKITVNDDVVGAWFLISEGTLFDSPIERSLPFTISIETPSGNSENKEDEDQKEVNDENTTWLQEIHHFTRTEVNIDITLPHLDSDEICYFITPDAVIHTEDEADINGVKVQAKSSYVSCRVTLGPITSELLGTWTLCAKQKDGEQKRCQRATIEWNNNNNPSSLWESRIQPRFTHPVNLNGVLRPVVLGLGNLLTCHIITPAGEDLVVTSELEYPGISHALASSGCSVSIGPLERHMLGEWTIYGKFRSAFGLNEVRLPMMLELYDTENPYAQAYNVTVLDPIKHVVNLGNTVAVEVTGGESIDSCEYITPTGKVYQKNEVSPEGVQLAAITDITTCRITIGPVTEELLGQWQIIGKFNDGQLFDEKQQSFKIIKEDPDNPIVDDNRLVENIDNRVLETKIGAVHEISITPSNFVNRESCHVRAPSGRQYTIMEGFNVDGVEEIEGANIECGIRITVSEAAIGEWILISRATLFSDPVERRLTFRVSVEETADPFYGEITIIKGNDLYLRLKNPTDKVETCKLESPNEDSSAHEIDTANREFCGFIVRSVAANDSGTWTIVFGDTIVYKASIKVNAFDRSSVKLDDIIVRRNSRINQEIGPEDMGYCKLMNPKFETVYEDFGRCVLSIDRVTSEHEGYWKMSIGFLGQIHVEEQRFKLTIVNEAPLEVETSVERERPEVTLTCSVQSTEEIHTCKFRDPKGNILLASPGIGEGRYVSLASTNSTDPRKTVRSCGIRLVSPTVEDLGFWRCGIETEAGTYYGFLSVLCPWLMEKPEIQQQVVTVPELTPVRTRVSAVEGDLVSISCSIPSPIKYCYLRAQNGTVYILSPGASSSPSVQYLGGGLQAGECGGRLRAGAGDAGRWTCRAGLPGQEEQWATLYLNVIAPITVRHYQHRRRGLILEAQVSPPRRLDYCRFVRIDGLGFLNSHAPAGYVDQSSLARGKCFLILEEPTMLNLHPWTVAVRRTGELAELSAATTENLLWIERGGGGRPFSVYLWTLVMALGLTMLLLCITLGPKKNREWTYARVSKMRTSIRSSFRKNKPAETA